MSETEEKRMNAGETARLSHEHYLLGNSFRREGKWHEAINEYIAAIELNPESPAVEAKRMLDDILNFYNKDAYNP